ncbi:MAG: hypothetical protein M3437_17730 [Chloroflexota bacterium]|nr:hypothetical protein [Chloroflexota bacterium]MDQ5865840.1 hypothetical protein [Chloroflexota bacterium]
MRKRMITFTLVAVSGMFVGSLFQPFRSLDALAQWAAPGEQCKVFAETRKALCGKFMHYWERNGGLQRFGYPSPHL